MINDSHAPDADTSGVARFVLEVQRRAFGGKLHVSGDGSRDVIASLTALSGFARTRCEAFAVALDAFDRVSRARRFVGDGVVSELVDCDAGLDGAGFVDGVL